MTLWMPIKKPLYAPMLATFGGGSVRGFKGAGGGVTIGEVGSAKGTLDILNDGSCVSCLRLNNSGSQDLNTSNNIGISYGLGSGGFQTSVAKWSTGSFEISDGSTSDYFFVNGLDLSGGNGDFTISAWFQLKTIRTSSCQPVLFMTSGTSTKGEGQITVAHLGGGTGSGSYGKGRSGATVLDSGYDTGTDVVINTWYHGLHTYNSTTDEYKMYLDGTLLSTVSNASTTGSDPVGLSNSANVDILLGHEPDAFHDFGGFDGGQNIDGYIDQVRIFDKALNATEIGYVYEERVVS